MDGNQSALSSIYDAAINKDSWQRALDGVVDMVGARASALIIKEQQYENPYEINALCSRYHDFIASPAGQHYIDNLRHLESGELTRFAEQRACVPFTDEMLGLTPEHLDSREDCLHLRKHAGVRRRIGVRLNDNRAWFDGMTIGLAPEFEIIPEQCFLNLNRLLPHLAKAIEVGRAFSVLRSRYKAVLSALDKFGVGIALALPSGEIIISNIEAQRIFDTSGALRLRLDNHVECSDSGMTGRLYEGIRRASLTAQGEDHPLAAPLQLRGQSSEDSILVDIASLSDGEAEIERGLVGALIYLIDEANPPKLNVERFATLHDLTKAETDVCAFLAQGDSTAVIAERRSTSVHTARGQVRSVLAKTGCQNRTQLLRLIVKSLPPVM